MISKDKQTNSYLGIKNLKSQLNKSYKCPEKLMSLLNPDLHKLSTVFIKLTKSIRP